MIKNDKGHIEIIGDGETITAELESLIRTFIETLAKNIGDDFAMQVFDEIVSSAKQKR